MTTAEPMPSGEPVESAAAPWARSARRTAVVSVLTFLAVAAGGIPLGLLWSWLSPNVPMVMTAARQVVVNDAAPEQLVAADGWFTMLGVGFGIAAGLIAWLTLRRHRGPGLLLGVVAGALAAAPIAWQVGRQLGLAGFDRWRTAATAGATFNRPPDLHAHGALLVPAFAAVIVCTLLAGWASDPDLNVASHDQGYGGDEAGDGLSSGSPDAPPLTGAPAPPAPDAAVPPPG